MSGSAEINCNNYYIGHPVMEERLTHNYNLSTTTTTVTLINQLQSIVQLCYQRL